MLKTRLSDFYINLKNYIPQENNQVDGTIIYGIERIWLYLIKFNGYYNKKIFKYLIRDLENS